MAGQTTVGAILLSLMLLYTEAKPRNACPAGNVPACPQHDPRLAVLVPHATDCEWYFECSNGIPYCMPCPAGEHFNPILRVCDYPEHAGCGTVYVTPEDKNISPKINKLIKKRVFSGNDKTSPPVKQLDPAANGVKNICPAAEAPACPAQDPRMAVLLAHPTSCEWYFECSNGIPYCMPCPIGEHFNPRLKVCDYPEHAGCGTTDIIPKINLELPKEGVPSKSEPSSGNDKPSLSIQQPDPPAKSVKNICPAVEAPACPAQDPRMAVLLAHPTSCEWYFECSNGIPYCMPCPAGEHFNPKLKVCDYPEHASCGAANVISKNNEETPKERKIPEIAIRPLPITLPVEPKPEIPANVKYVCPAADAPACPAQDPRMAVLLAHPTSCEWYFECSNGIPYCMPCPVGEHFNPILKVCDYPEHASCEAADVIPKNNEETPKERKIPEIAIRPLPIILPVELKPEIPANVKNVCPAAEAPACPAQDPRMAVLLAHPISCEWYFECSNGIPYCMPCPAGEYFNPELKVCDYPEHSGCTAKIVQ